MPSNVNVRKFNEQLATLSNLPGAVIGGAWKWRNGTRMSYRSKHKSRETRSDRKDKKAVPQKAEECDMPKLWHRLMKVRKQEPKHTKQSGQHYWQLQEYPWVNVKGIKHNGN